MKLARLHRSSKAISLSLLAGLVFTVGPTPQAHAATWTVTKTSDTADGLCNQDCSLREAIMAANTTATADSISLLAGTYTLSIVGDGEDAAATGDLDIGNDITITGLAAGTTIIDGGDLDRVFDIHVGTVLLDGLTLQHGTADKGGGIRNQGTLVVRKSTIRENTANSFGGGAIHNGAAGVVSVIESTLSGNTASEEGAGIYNAGTLNMLRSTVSANRGIDGSGGGLWNSGTLDMRDSVVDKNTHRYGGGIVSGGTLTVVGSTISNNSSTEAVGGIRNSGTMSLRNSTLSGNIGRDEGGGIHNSGTGSLNNVTIVNNTNEVYDDYWKRGGGGLQNIGQLQVANTIIAKNTDATGRGPDCFGALVSQGYNLFTTTTGCTLSGVVTGNIVGQDPKLGSLQDNGGLTPTHALLPSSPAIDTGNPGAPSGSGNTCEAVDQRGVIRPQASRPNREPRCDIGAYEFAHPKTYLPRVAR